MYFICCFFFLSVLFTWSYVYIIRFMITHNYSSTCEVILLTFEYLIVTIIKIKETNYYLFILFLIIFSCWKINYYRFKLSRKQDWWTENCAMMNNWFKDIEIGIKIKFKCYILTIIKNKIAGFISAELCPLISSYLYKFISLDFFSNFNGLGLNCSYFLWVMPLEHQYIFPIQCSSFG